MRDQLEDKSTKRELTESALLVMECIDTYWREKHMPPSLREICVASGITSTSHISYLVNKLIDHGKLVPKVGLQNRAYVPMWVVQALEQNG